MSAAHAGLLVPGARRLSRPLLVALLGAAVVGTGAGVAFRNSIGSGSANSVLVLPVLHGQAVWPAGLRRAPPLALRDQNGRRVSLAGQRGRTVVVAFMDPLCRQACALEAQGLALAERQVAPAQRPVLLVVSVNPLARAREAKAAIRAWGITGDRHWLLGGRAQLAAVWRAYGIAVHSAAAVYLIDRRGFERAGFIAPFLPQFFADDLRELAREPA